MGLAVLFAGAFVMGTSEMLVVGLIELIARDFAVSVPAAGALVTANALGLAIGGPVLALATWKIDRRRVVIACTAAFTVLTLVPLRSSEYWLFIAARVTAGAAQGLFIAAAIGVSTSLVPAERAGRAMAVVISGFASASALGLPLGTFLGQVLGWRWSFGAILLVTIVILTAELLVIPATPAERGRDTVSYAREVLSGRVLVVLAFCALVFAGLQAALTYAVPFLTDISGVAPEVVGVYLLAYGVATTVGSAFGGRFADRNAAVTLIVGTVGVIVSLTVLATLGAHPLVALLAIIGLGLFAMGMAPSMQHRVAHLAGRQGGLAASLPSSAVNVGIAVGAVVGGLAIDLSGVSAVSVAGGILAVVALGLALASRSSRAPTSAST